MCGHVVEPERPQTTIWRPRIACWIPKATNTHSQYVTLLSHCYNVYTNAPQCYVIRTLPVVFYAPVLPAVNFVSRSNSYSEFLLDF